MLGKFSLLIPLGLILWANLISGHGDHDDHDHDHDLTTPSGVTNNATVVEKPPPKPLTEGNFPKMTTVLRNSLFTPTFSSLHLRHVVGSGYFHFIIGRRRRVAVHQTKNYIR